MRTSTGNTDPEKPKHTLFSSGWSRRFSRGAKLAWFCSAVGLLSCTKDSCLDRGGCWDSVDEVCRITEPNAQQLCDRSK